MMKFKNGLEQIRMEHPTFKWIPLLLARHLMVDLMLMLNIPPHCTCCSRVMHIFFSGSNFVFFSGVIFFFFFSKSKLVFFVGSSVSSGVLHSTGLEHSLGFKSTPTYMWGFSIPLHQNPPFSPTGIWKLENSRFHRRSYFC